MVVLGPWVPEEGLDCDVVDHCIFFCRRNDALVVVADPCYDVVEESDPWGVAAYQEGRFDHRHGEPFQTHLLRVGLAKPERC